MTGKRFEVLDGWRAISILMVLLCHFFPIGPNKWYLGKMVGDYAITIFFILSGFLISNGLLSGQTVKSFLIRRLFRVLPLAWVYLSIVIIFYQMSLDSFFAHYFFYANYPPKPLIPHVTDHFWSLCLEVQFYAGIALLFAFFRKRAILIIPILCLIFTLLRVINGVAVSVVSHYRIDDILAGSLLAIVLSNRNSFIVNDYLAKVNPIWFVILLFPASHQYAGWICYFRPYIAAILIGSTICQPDSKLTQLLINRPFAYIASISYALYVTHPLIAQTWLGTGEMVEKYLKRPLLLSTVFLISHISTKHFESRMIALAKKMTKSKSY